MTRNGSTTGAGPRRTDQRERLAMTDPSPDASGNRRRFDFPGPKPPIDLLRGRRP